MRRISCYRLLLWMHTAALCGLLLGYDVLPAEGGQPQVELLWPEGAPGAKGDQPEDKPTLQIHLADPAKSTGAAVIICPGGGYRNLAMDHEGRQIADWLNTLGVSAFVCDYRHRGKGYGYPAPLDDAQRAIRTVRSRADEFHVDPQKIGILGFSAGGHLASTAATHFDDGDASDLDPIMHASSRPDFAILCYPVITMLGPPTHGGSRRNLLGDDPPAELVQSLSNELQVTPQTPPTFLFHTSEDQAVPPANSLLFYAALQKAGVPAELHIYERGKHGIGLGRGTPGTEDWPQRCAEWLRMRGLLEK